MGVQAFDELDIAGDDDAGIPILALMKTLLQQRLRAGRNESVLIVLLIGGFTR